MEDLNHSLQVQCTIFVCKTVLYLNIFTDLQAAPRLHCSQSADVGTQAGGGFVKPFIHVPSNVIDVVSYREKSFLNFAML